MKENIGLYLITIAITIFCFVIEVDFTTKEKIKGIVGTVAFITLIFAGSYLAFG